MTSISPVCGRCSEGLTYDEVQAGLSEEKQRQLDSPHWRCGKCRLIEQYKPLHLLDDETMAKMSAILDEEPGLHRINPINQAKRKG